MSSMEERVHPASARQRERFRDRGEIANSRDLTAFGVLLGGVIALVGLAGASSAALVSFASRVFGNLHATSAGELASPAVVAFAYAVGPLTLACFVGALLVGLLQTRGSIAREVLKFDLSRINPVSKLADMLNPKKAAGNLATSLVKVVTLLAVCIYTLWHEIPNLLDAPATSLTTAVSAGAAVLGTVAVRALVTILAIGVADFAINWFKLERKMRMTTKELQDDMKEEQGDPHVRAARRRRARELARARSMKDVAKSDVVIVNPTHFAVALAYRPGMSAPRVVAKGMNRAAERIRGIARTAGVPVLSQPPLCRAIYKQVKVGREVPADLYQAVAVVLAQVYRVRRGVA
jgi:flagellar biosynthetic protein FlhB